MKNYKIKTTVRRALGAAPPGMSVGIADYSSQELRVIACVAQIKNMLTAFFSERDNPILIRPDTGEEYVNPDSDLHTYAASKMYPELQSVPKWELVKEAKKDMGGWKRRDRGKVCGFTVCYGGSGNRIATALHIDPAAADDLLNTYFQTFPELKLYLDNTATLAKYQKFVDCSLTGRRYFIGESNAKGLADENSAVRKAQNTLIQGSAAIMTKKAMWLVSEAFDELNYKYSADIPEGKDGQLIAVIHDELVVYVPGERILVDIKEVDGKFIPEYKFSNLSKEFALAVQKGMEKAMDELLQPLVPNFPSKADCQLGISWADK